MGTHTHHIIPKHMGGTDEPENLIQLTVEEHAEAHRKLYEEYGHWQDHVAWKALSGQIKNDDVRRLVTRLSNANRIWTEESKEKTRKSLAKTRETKGGISAETRQKMSNTRKGRKITWNTNSTSAEANMKRSKTMAGIAKPKVKCPHCRKEGGVPQMTQWHFDNCKKRVV